MKNYDVIPSQGARVRITYPDGGGPSYGLTIARHGGYEPTYKVWHYTGITAWYPASWLTRADDPDVREVVRL